jgi:hypothetical protein
MEEYQASSVPMTLTSYEVARLLADALESEPLADLAADLRFDAREAGLLRGAVYKLGGKASSWVTIFDAPDDKFEVSDSSLAITGVRPVGRICTAVPLTGEYELRCQLGRVGEISRTTFQGVVFAGTPNDQWFTVGIDGKGQLVVRRQTKNSSELTLKLIKLEPPVAKDESPSFAVHVSPGNKLSVTVGDRAQVEIELEEDLPRTAYVGISAKNGRTELGATVLEVFP